MYILRTVGLKEASSVLRFCAGTEDGVLKAYVSYDMHC